VPLSRDTTRLLPVVVPVALGGALATGIAGWLFAGSGPGLEELVALLALLVASIFAEAIPVPIEGVPVGGTSLANVFIVTAAVFYGGAAGVLLAVAAMALVEITRHQTLLRLSYNVGLYSLAGAAAGLAAQRAQDGGPGSLALAALAGSAAFYATDILLLAMVVARSERERFSDLLRRHFVVTALPFSIMASVTIVVALLWDRSPLLSLVLIGPLIAVALYERAIYGALDRLRELDRLKDEFIAIVSHELRTPLSSVYGAAATLQQRELDKDVQDSLLSIIYRESDRLARLVDDVLWVSRLESGRVETSIAPCDATELATDAVHAAEAHLPDGFTLEFTCAQSLPPLAADGQKLRQVLANIIENAVKYSPDGGRIAVNVERRNGSVVFAVRDEGLGIPADEQSRIFEKFHRLDPNLTRGVSGTGLGLYICRELIRQMNGTISVTSSEGNGSTFTIELPSAEGDGHAPVADEPGTPSQPRLRATLAEAFSPVPPDGDEDESRRALRDRVGSALSRALPHRHPASRR